MNKEEWFIKVQETIDKFPVDQKEEMYKTSALFHTVVTALAQGQDPYDLIIQLIKASETAQKALEFYILNNPYPYKAF